MITPQITYTDADGPATLDFVYPPTDKPFYSAQAKRTDAFSTSGKRQSIVLRTDRQHPITMAAIIDDGTDTSDAAQWMRFVKWAETGGPFLYNPDTDTFADGIPCFLVETAGVLKRAGFMRYSFSGTFQEEA